MITEGQAPHASPPPSYLWMKPGTQLRDVYKIRFEYLNQPCGVTDTGDTWNIKTLKVTYGIDTSNGVMQGVLMHHRGAPA